MNKILAAALAVICIAAGADATVLNLDSLSTGYITQTVVIGDYSISPSGNNSANPYITSINGHNVLIGTNTSFGDDPIIRRVDGGAFTLNSVVIGVQSYQTGQAVIGSNGQVADLSNVATTNQQTINFGSQFQNVTSVDLNALNNAYYTNIMLSAASVPEPTTWIMMVFGFGAIGLTVRRRDRRAAEV